MKKYFNDIAAVLLAGGKNTRYGFKNKALLEINGVSFYQRTIHLLEEIFENIIVITNNAEDFPDDGHKKHPDIFKNIGPVGGIHSALFHAKDKEAIFVTAADMPFLNEKIIRRVLNTFKNKPSDILFPRTANFLEPLCAIYKTSLINKLEDFIRIKDSYSIIDLIGKADVNYMDLENNFETTKALVNINTPADFEKIQHGGCMIMDNTHIEYSSIKI